MELPDRQKIAIKKISQKFGLVLMLQFGSSIEENNIYLHKESDIDIAFLSDNKDFSFKQLINLQYELAKIFSVFEDKIDLVNLRNASSLLGRKIADSSIILYDFDHHQFNQFYIYAQKRYIEEKDIYELENHYLKQKISRRSYAR